METNVRDPIKFRGERQSHALKDDFFQEQNHQLYINSTRLFQPVEWYKLSSSIEINKPIPDKA